MDYNRLNEWEKVASRWEKVAFRWEKVAYKSSYLYVLLTMNYCMKHKLAEVLDLKWEILAFRWEKLAFRWEILAQF